MGDGSGKCGGWVWITNRSSLLHLFPGSLRPQFTGDQITYTLVATVFPVKQELPTPATGVSRLPVLGFSPLPLSDMASSSDPIETLASLTTKLKVSNDQMNDIVTEVTDDSSVLEVEVLGLDGFSMSSLVTRVFSRKAPKNNKPVDEPTPNQAQGKDKITFYFGKQDQSKDGNRTPSNPMTRTLVAKKDIKESPKEMLEISKERDKGTKEDVSTKEPFLVDLLGDNISKENTSDLTLEEQRPEQVLDTPNQISWNHIQTHPMIHQNQKNDPISLPLMNDQKGGTPHLNSLSSNLNPCHANSTLVTPMHERGPIHAITISTSINCSPGNLTAQTRKRISIKDRARKFTGKNKRRMCNRKMNWDSRRRLFG
ncbi:hypothetical protein L6452_25151 [Arctium lappa]|uniref:Uncharacterized protein n=1 Tax=Arctium lappa TaxID=4217 RepID=A0ACB9A9W4_ARCLA|nr:hypothetical protein L6452_25151 [Arctium lappa]